MPHVLRGAVAALALCAIATGAAAQNNAQNSSQNSSQNNSSSTTVVVNPAPASPSGDPSSSPFAATTEILGAEALDAESVQALVAQSNQSLTATNSDNSVTADTIQSGDIVIESDGFAGFSGIGNFVMNTGNNNNLQGSVSVVVVTTPAAP